jgi:hypothetical protein
MPSRSASSDSLRSDFRTESFILFYVPWYAERVLACVGPHENDSASLTREIQKLHGVKLHGVLVHASHPGFTGLRQGMTPDSTLVRPVDGLLRKFRGTGSGRH